MSERKERQANFELLRILAMLMVVAMHFLSHTGGILPPAAGRMPEMREISGVLVESFCIVAVNVYVIISGYFLSEKSFSFRRLLRLLCQILFYTLLIPPVLAAAGVLEFSEISGIYHIWNCLFPVQSGHYWFVTAYVILVLFTPFLNAAVRVMSRGQLRVALGVLLVLFCLGKSLSPLQFTPDRYGYDSGWFFCLYLTGAYLRRYKSTFFGKKGKSAALYVFSCLLTACVALGSLWLCGKKGLLEYYATVPFHYNYILAYTGALGLTGLFAGIRIPPGRLSGRICRISGTTFGVYLIHEHADISERWTGWILGEASARPAVYLAQMAGSVLLVFVLAFAVDLLRDALFKWAKKGILRTASGRKLAEGLRRADAYMEF